MSIDKLMAGEGIEAVTKPKLEHYSFSSLNLLNSCERAWYGRYIEGLRDDIGEKAVFGLSFEACFAKRIGFEIDEDDQKRLDDNSETFPDMQSEIEKSLSLYQSHPRAWKKAKEYQLKTELDPDKFAHLAKKLGVTGKLHLPYIGYIDFKNDDTIMDMKTTGKAGWKPDWALQLIGYMLSTNTKKSEIHSFVRAKRSPRPVFYDVPLTDEYSKVLLQWIANLSDKAQKLESGEITPSLTCGWRCAGYCPVKDCPGQLLNKIEPAE